MSTITRLNGTPLPTKNKAAYVLKTIRSATLLNVANARKQLPNVLAVSKYEMYDEAIHLSTVDELIATVEQDLQTTLLYVPDLPAIGF